MDNIDVSRNSENNNGSELSFNWLSQEEERVRQELNDILLKNSHIKTKVMNITKTLPLLEALHSDSIKLYDMISYTSTLSDNISAKVRKLDMARSRVSECQKRVHDLLDLQLCSAGVETSLTTEDFEKAAAHIHRYLSMDQRLLEKTADDMQQDCTTVSNCLSFLHDAGDKLRNVITERFDEAIRKDDVASVERFFKLFPLLNMRAEPLQTYSKYLAKKIESSTQKSLQTALAMSPTDKRASIVFADVITSLFESIAKVIEVQQPLVETYYGPSMLVEVVEVMQRVCDSEASVILSKWQQVRAVDRLCKAVRVSASSKPHPLDLDLLLAEITTIQSRFNLYKRFIARKLNVDVAEKLLSKSKLFSLMHDLLSSYLLLEDFYMSESVKKAISMDTVDPSSPVTSMVDDVFFIVKKSIRRAGLTGNLDGVCAVINHGCGVLETELSAALERTMRMGFTTAYLDLTQAYNVMIQGKSSTDAIDSAKTLFIKHLNNSEVCMEYVGTLAESLAVETKVRDETERRKLEGCLSGLSGVSAALGAARDLGLHQLRLTALKPRIAPWIDAFASLSHALSEDEFSSYEANEPFTRSLIGHLDGLLSEFKESLTAQNYESVVSIVATEVATHMEKVIMKTAFNRYGGLAVDKEIRCIVSYLSSATSWSVRDKLARLSQIATVLNLEKVSEMADYWKQTSLTWRLTPPDVTAILKLRTDFKSEDIARLKL